MTEGERVKQVRKLSGLSMEKFGERIGMVKSSISNIESGNRALSDQLSKLISREFNVREDWLRTGEGEMFVEMSEEDELIQWAEKSLASETAEFRLRFAKLLARLNDDQWIRLAEFAKALAGMEEAEAQAAGAAAKTQQDASGAAKASDGTNNQGAEKKPRKRLPEPPEQGRGPVLKAAHARTDVAQTAEGKKHDDDIMDDDSEWE